MRAFLGSYFLQIVVVMVTLSHVIEGMVPNDSPRRKQELKKQQRLLLSDDGLLATTSLRDHLRVQEILQNRHARREPRLGSLESVIERKRANTEEYYLDESGRAEEGRWLSLPSRPRRSASLPKGARSKKISSTPWNTTSTVRVSSMPNGLYIPFEFTLEALQAFHKEHSHLVLPRKYSVPESPAYPSIWHGVDLAGTVYTMRWWQRHVKNQPDRVSELNKIGFVWERLQPEWNLILESLIVYKALHGNVLVPSTFVIPYDDNRWPKACWGISLGNSVYKIRNRGDYLGGRNTNSGSRREQLDALGFVWDVQELRFHKFTAALKLFAKHEQDHSSSMSHSGALKVPSQFVVPRSSVWPTEFWGYRLGERCTQVRQKELYIKGHPQRSKILADLGFYVTGGNNNLRWLEVVHAAAVYSQLNNRELDVPTKFVVPAPPRRVGIRSEGKTSIVVGSDDAWPWPEYLWGFPLGQRLRDIRVKGNYLKGKSADARRRQLDALGFNWEPKRGRRMSKD